MKLTEMNIKQGDVYQSLGGGAENSRRPIRRVVGVVSEKVFYSTGGDRNYTCNLKTFAQWADSKIHEGMEQ